MRASWLGPLLLLCCACGSLASHKGDAGSARDAGMAGARDAAASSSADSGTVGPGGDGGLTDGGKLTCTLEKAAAAVQLSGYQQENELADLVARDGLLGFAYSWNHLERRLHVADAATLAVKYDGVVAAISGGAIPRALDLAAGTFFLAGNYDATGQTPFVRLAYLDAAGAAQGDWTSNEITAMAAARERSGGRVLALGTLVGADQPILENRYDLTGRLTGSNELGRDTRSKNEWDLDWAYEADRGFACGVAPTADGEALSLFELSGSVPTVYATAIKLVQASTTATSSFGCRIALGAERAVVALAEGDGKARLVWLTLKGAIEAGPLPFAAWRTAQKYDVAINGAVTALAFLDDSSGLSHAVVRIYPSPAEAPIELWAESDLNLAGFDVAGRRVRLAAIQGGFAVAFDAGIKTGQTDLYVRRILCE